MQLSGPNFRTLAEQSHESTSDRERGMRGPASRKFNAMKQAQRIVSVHAAVSNLFNLAGI
jgi:putative transposase